MRPLSRFLLSLIILSFTLRAQFTQQRDLGVANGQVALSADGNTAIVGEASDNNGIGGARIFIRTSGTWSQQGPELAGTNVVPTNGAVSQGSAVAISGDGNTAAVGGPDDGGNFQGAVWVFARSGGVWRQQSKLVGSDSGVATIFGRWGGSLRRREHRHDYGAGR